MKTSDKMRTQLDQKWRVRDQNQDSKIDFQDVFRWTDLSLLVNSKLVGLTKTSCTSLLQGAGHKPKWAFWRVQKLIRFGLDTIPDAIYLIVSEWNRT